MDKKEFTFGLTTKLSKIFDKNFFHKVKDFEDNININFILSNRLKNINHKWNKELNLMFHEANIKNVTVTNEKIFFTDKGYMVNMYFIDQEYFKTKKEYMDFNLGLLLNNVLGLFDMKYNFTGLYYIYSKRNIHNELFVTKSFEKICELLVLDINRYKQGFKNENEMFSWLVESPYIDTEKILSNKKIKNKIFIQFKDYIKNNNIKTDIEFKDSLLFDIITNKFTDTDFSSFIKQQNRQLASSIA